MLPRPKTGKNVTSIKTILVDDEPLALRGLEIRLEKFGDVEIVDTCENGRKAIKAIKLLKPDLVFLDIQMPGLDGLAVVRALVGEDLPLIVFVTAFDQYAIKAFETHTIDYLLKPVEEDSLDRAVDRVRRQIRQRSAIRQNARLIDLIREMDGPGGVKLAEIIKDAGAPPADRYGSRLNIKDGGHIICLEMDEIDWIEAAGDYMCIHAGATTHVLRETMKGLEKILDPKKFQRIHRSTIVNVDRVRELHPYSNGEYFLVLKNGNELKTSRTYKNAITRFL